MLLYQILSVCGSFWEMASPKWACLGEREKGLGDLRLRVLAGGWVWGVGGGSGCVGGLVCCGVWMDCREEVGGAIPPSDVMGRENRAAGTLVCRGCIRCANVLVISEMRDAPWY